MEALNRITQITSLVWWIDTETSYTGFFRFKGIDDSLKVKVTNNNKVVQYEYVMENYSKKAPSIVDKELTKIANNLVNIKEEFN